MAGPFTLAAPSASGAVRRPPLMEKLGQIDEVSIETNNKALRLRNILSNNAELAEALELCRDLNVFMDF